MWLCRLIGVRNILTIGMGCCVLCMWNVGLRVGIETTGACLGGPLGSGCSTVPLGWLVYDPLLFHLCVLVGCPFLWFYVFLLGAGFPSLPLVCHWLRVALVCGGRVGLRRWVAEVRDEGGRDAWDGAG